MLPTQHFLAFLLTVSVLILIPGPSVLFVIGRGVALGRRAPLATVLGNSCGFALQLIAVGLSATGGITLIGLGAALAATGSRR